MIVFKDVWVSFAEQQVLRGVSFTAPAGQITALIGPSGSGKSTALRLVMGFVAADKGQILVDGEDVTSLGERQWRDVRRKMGMVFQSSALFDSMTVSQNVGFYPHYVEREPWRKVEPRVMDLLAELDMAEAADKLPGELSGGMQRRVALARSLIYRPKILLYDEPTTGLDPHMSAVVTELIAEMNEKYSVTSVVVSHDLPSIHDIASHVVLIHDGLSVTVGTPDQLLHSTDEQVKKFAGIWRDQIRMYATELSDTGDLPEPSPPAGPMSKGAGGNE
jgi:phospholipid/cholesterol/gamma-HCH transport system ATP-binding protein